MNTCFKLTVAAVAVLCAAVGSVAARPQDCANTKAYDVPGTLRNQGAIRKCGFGIVIFGVGGGIFGRDCPAARERTPAHQTCSEANTGTACVPDDDMDVTIEKCHCSGLIIPIIELGIPTECVCGEAFTCGTIEDFKTEACGAGG